MKQEMLHAQRLSGPAQVQRSFYTKVPDPSDVNHIAQGNERPCALQALRRQGQNISKTIYRVHDCVASALAC
jgi:hypothetical protein